MDIEQLVTIKEASQELGVTITAIHNALNEGRLPFTVVFGRRVIHRDDLEAYRARTQPDGIKPKGRPRKQPDTTET